MFRRLLAFFVIMALPIAANAEIKEPELLSKELPHDIVYGSNDAPVTIIEYASLSCGHCKNFYENVFVELEKTHIDEGKVKLIYRHFPLNLPALKAAMLVECIDSDKKKKRMVATLFKAQEDWAHSSSEEEFTAKLSAISRIGGISQERFGECVNNKGMEEEILKLQMEAGNGLNVTGTPAIFIDGKVYEGDRTLEKITEAIGG